MGDIPHAELAGERLEDLACDAGLLRLDDLQCFRRTSCCRAPCAPNAQAERPASSRPAPACCSSDLARAGIRSRAWRRHHAELPQRVEIVDDAALPEHLAVTNLENDDLFELHALSRGGQGPPLTALRSRDR